MGRLSSPTLFFHLVLFGASLVTMNSAFLQDITAFSGSSPSAGVHLSSTQLMVGLSFMPGIFLVLNLVLSCALCCTEEDLLFLRSFIVLVHL